VREAAIARIASRHESVSMSDEHSARSGRPTAGDQPPADVPRATQAESCDWCGSTDLWWRNCKLLCRSCSAIVKSCADL
jgi:hypothetical protein